MFKSENFMGNSSLKANLIVVTYYQIVFWAHFFDYVHLEVFNRNVSNSLSSFQQVMKVLPVSHSSEVENHSGIIRRVYIFLRDSIMVSCCKGHFIQNQIVAFVFLLIGRDAFVIF